MIGSRGSVQTEPPINLRLDDGRYWQLVKALLLLTPGASTTDAKHVENLAFLPEDRSSTPSSRVIDCGRRDVMELSTAAEPAMSRRKMVVVSCLGSSEPADCQSCEAEKCTDITVPVRERHTRVVSSCRAQEEIYMDQEAIPATMNKSGPQIEAEKLSQDRQTTGTVLVWIDGVWSGEPVSCKPLLAGGGRLKNHAIDAPRVSRWEASDCRWKQDRDIDENSERCRVAVNEAVRYAKNTAEHVIPVSTEVPDAIKRVKESEEQFLGLHDVLELARKRAF